MSFSKYFKLDQKLQLRPLGDPAGDSSRQETLTVYFSASGPGYCDLRLPYHTAPGEAFPFTPEMPVELIGESLGMGLLLKGVFLESLGGEQIRVSLQPGLQMFQRRQNSRGDSEAGLRFTRGRGSLRSYRDQWEKNIRILQNTKDLSKVSGFPRRTVNISATGIRFRMQPPVEVADLCMVLVELDPGKPPLCALAEVVWTSAETDAEGLLIVGMQFLNILKEDQKRIERYVKKLARQEAEENPAKDGPQAG